MKRNCACSIDLNRNLESRSLRHRNLSETAQATAADSERLYIDVVYWVLYRNDNENLSTARLQSQHQMINAGFNHLHLRTSRVPSAGRYNHAANLGTANIVCLPSNHNNFSENQVQRIAVSQEFSGLAAVLLFLAGRGISISSTALNVIIAPLESILGEAALESNVFVVHTGTVGGDLVTGTLTPYHLGLTAVHEFGHCLGLPHVFTLSGCTQAFSDIPAQVNPNYDFQLVDTGSGFTGNLCNRDRDCKFYRNGDSSVLVSGVSQPYSCFGCASDPTCPECDSGIYEMGCNYMDYGVDEVLVMFSRQQVISMRETLLSGDTGLALKPSDGDEVSTVGTTTVTSTDSSGLSIGAIIGIAVGSAVFVAIVIGLLVWGKKRGKI